MARAALRLALLVKSMAEPGSEPSAAAARLEAAARSMEPEADEARCAVVDAEAFGVIGLLREAAYYAAQGEREEALMVAQEAARVIASRAEAPQGAADVEIAMRALSSEKVINDPELADQPGR